MLTPSNTFALGGGVPSLAEREEKEREEKEEGKIGEEDEEKSTTIPNMPPPISTTSTTSTTSSTNFRSSRPVSLPANAVIRTFDEPIRSQPSPIGQFRSFSFFSPLFLNFRAKSRKYPKKCIKTRSLAMDVDDDDEEEDDDDDDEDVLIGLESAAQTRGLLPSPPSPPAPPPPSPPPQKIPVYPPPFK